MKRFTIRMKINKQKKLLEILQDNQFHSGESIGKQLKISRAAVWKLAQSLQELGFQIAAMTRRGYQLINRFSFLSLDKIKAQLAPATFQLFRTIEIFDQIDSTNTYLLQRIFEYSKSPRICIAEQQLFGRGRRERTWHSPFGQNIHLSILWSIESKEQIHTLPLVICLAILKTLEKLSIPEHAHLKWPNDIYYHGKKLGGVLVETYSQVNETSQIVIGIGLNINMLQATKKMIDQPWISLAQICNKVFDRNILIARLIENCVLYLNIFSIKNFDYFRTLWNKYDICSNKLLQVHCNGLFFEGIGQGVDQEGRLQIAISKNKKMNVSSGEIISRIQMGE